MSDLMKSIHVSTSGMKTQSARMKVVAENIANATSTAEVAGGEPYRRKTISFRNVVDKHKGVEVVAVSEYGEDSSDFKARYQPGHPAADNKGYVLYPNVNNSIEMMDMREANRSYEANLKAVETSKRMIRRTLELLR